MLNPSKIFISWELWKQIAVVLLATVIIVASISGLMVRKLETAYLLENLRQNSKKTIALLSAASIDAIITEDRPLLQTIVTRSARLDPQIFSIRIENEEGIVLAQWQNSDYKPSLLPMPCSENIVFSEETFGKITIKWIVDVTYQKIEEHVRQAILFATGTILLLAAIIIFSIHLLMIRPIRRIHQQLIELANGSDTSKLDLFASRELTFLAESVNTLRELLKFKKSREWELETKVRERTAELTQSNEQMKREIAERKRAEEKLRRAHDELELRVEERTAELVKANEHLEGEIEERKKAVEERKKLEAQFQQAQKMESIGTLAGGIAHDFNNMLGIIVGNTELAMDDVPEWNPARHNLEEIRTASMRARDVVKQILAFSRQSLQEMKPVRISPIIKESLKLLRSSIPTIIEIHQDISNESDTVRADPTQINQVLINLCTNAAHAMGEKGGVLEVSLKNIEIDEDSAIHYYDLSSGKYVRLTVSDTGHGIEPKILERIFDPYFTTKKVGEGSGMGLSVVHGIVKAHGGDILVDSELGKGTTFQVFFHCIESKLEQEIEITVEIPRGNERILFVDDEKAMVDAIQPMIERLGYKVTARTSSIEALEAFRANPDRFDLVITDFTMPNMTGMELAKELLKLRSDILIILCTGYSEHINEDKAKGSGIRAFVMKPVVLGEIANTIRKVLDQEKE